MTTWISQNAIALKTNSPNSNSKDLDAFGEIVQDATVVALGEATHGNKEFISIKHRITKFLVEKMGFNTVIIEMPQQLAEYIDLYIKTGQGSPQEQLMKMDYWIVQTQEILDLVNWMRAVNKKSPKNRINFYGCSVSLNSKLKTSNNITQDEGMFLNYINIIQRIGKDAKIILWAHNVHIAKFETSHYKSLGAILSQRIGSHYLSLAGICYEGSFNARKGDLLARHYSKKISQFPSTNSYEHLFALTCLPSFILDIRSIKSYPLFSSWYSYSYQLREVGAVFDQSKEDAYSQYIDLPNKFDGVIWIKKVTPSTLLSRLGVSMNRT